MLRWSGVAVSACETSAVGKFSAPSDAKRTHQRYDASSWSWVIKTINKCDPDGSNYIITNQETLTTLSAVMHSWTKHLNNTFNSASAHARFRLWNKNYINNVWMCFVTLLFSVELKHIILAKICYNSFDLHHNEHIYIFFSCVDQTLVMVNFTSSAFWLVTSAQRRGCS